VLLLLLLLLLLLQRGLSLFPAGTKLLHEPLSYKYKHAKFWTGQFYLIELQQQQQQQQMK
jgi:hypothetical protein